jgi:uncharacterized protein YjbI with pentapeptide repeats
MTTTDTTTTPPPAEATPARKSFLGLILADQPRTLPAGYDTWGWKAVCPDLRTYPRHDAPGRRFRWPWPGGTVTDPTARPSGNECPTGSNGGYCIALNWDGARSGGYRGTTVLLLAYRQSDIMAQSAGKLRVREAHVADVIDAHDLIRRAGENGDLAGADLTRADLAGAYLAGADLAGADLAGADLAGANLTRANLTDANLTRANLAGAYLAGADLAGANLTGANLAGAYLAGAYLAGADLTGANLAGADLAGADLAGAYLTGADLAGADLAGADLAGAKNLDKALGLDTAAGYPPAAKGTP